MKINPSLRQTYSKWYEWHNDLSSKKQINLYIKNGRKPWSKGYCLFKENFIKKLINESFYIDTFRDGLPLPKHYGQFLDERVIEYPWCISRVNQVPSRLLDAGSALNFSYVLNHEKLQTKDITIATLEPESNCYWQNRISYIYSNILELPFKDDWFDEVASISTLEHIGMDNSIYSDNEKFKQKDKFIFLKAVSELKRVTKPGGKIYITIPYGRYTDFGYYQQFSAEMINLMLDTFSPNKVVETYYCYESGGWSISDKQYCQNFEGFNIHDTKYFNSNSTKDYDPDYAACSRAIAALEVWK